MVNERPRGVLTDADRKYLRMDPEERNEKYSRPARHKRRNTIQKRVRNGLFDIAPIYHKTSRDDREEIFGPVIETMYPWSPTNMVSGGVAFLLLGVLEQTNHEMDDEEFYETIFTESIRKTLTKVSHGAGNIEVDVTIDDWAAIDDFPAAKELAELRPEMLRSLLDAGEITNEDFAEGILKQKKKSEETDSA